MSRLTDVHFYSLFVKMLKVCNAVLSIRACLREYSANILIEIALSQL